MNRSKSLEAVTPPEVRLQPPADQSAAVQPPDGGFGWVIVACAFACNLMYGANFVLFSVYVVEFAEYFDKPQADISIIGSLDSATMMLMSFFAAPLSKKFGCRPVLMGGLLLCAVGVFASAFAGNMMTLLVTFGLIKGTGIGFIYVPANVLVQQYFTTRRTLASGMASCGLSTGTLVFGPIFHLLIGVFGWRGALICFAGIVVQIVAVAALMRPLPKMPPAVKLSPNEATREDDSINGKDVGTTCSDDVTVKEEERGENHVCSHSNSRTDRDVTKPLRKGSTVAASRRKSVSIMMKHVNTIFDFDLFKEPTFWMFLIGRTCSHFGVIAMYKYCVARAVSFGIDKLESAFIVTAIGISSLCFRFTAGAIGNALRWRQRLLYYGLSMCLGGAFVILSSLAGHEFYMHLIFGLAYGVMLGSFEALYPVVGTDLFGLHRLPSTLGMCFGCLGLMSFAYLPIIGVLYDVYQSFTPAFTVAGVVALAGGVFTLSVFITSRKKSGSSAEQV